MERLYFEMYLSLWYGCRHRIRPGGLSRAELLVADNHLRKFCDVFYELVYRTAYNGPPVCRFPMFSLLKIVPNTRWCGFVWMSWQFHAERLVGSLPGLIGSRSEPHPSMNCHPCQVSSRACDDVWCNVCSCEMIGRDGISTRRSRQRPPWNPVIPTRGRRASRSSSNTHQAF